MVGGAALGWLALVLGCGSPSVKIVPVRGKVTFRDGSLIQADRVLITFAPQRGAGSKPLPAAKGTLNVEDGSFSGLTTYERMDGAALGRHRVVIRTFNKGPGGKDVPVAAVPRRYTRRDTTPLEVVVKGSGASFALLIDR